MAKYTEIAGQQYGSLHPCFHSPFVRYGMAIITTALVYCWRVGGKGEAQNVGVHENDEFAFSFRSYEVAQLLHRIPPEAEYAHWRDLLVMTLIFTMLFTSDIYTCLVRNKYTQANKTSYNF